MPPRRTIPWPRPCAGPVFSLIVLAALAGCHVPRFKGPQIQNPPPAFIMKRDAAQEHRMFPEREVLFHEAWVEASSGNFSGIYINGHPGKLTRSDAAGARDAMMAAPHPPITFGDLEELSIDGRTSWGWLERWESREKGLQYVAYRAVVPYDTISYAVEFISGEPGLKGSPDSLRTIVASFADGRTTWNLPLIAVLVGLSLFAFNLVRGRIKRRQMAYRAITLASLPTKKEEGDTAARTTGGAPSPTGRSAPPPGPRSSPGGQATDTPPKPPAPGSGPPHP